MVLDVGPIFADDLLAKLDLNPWKTYIQVQAANAEEGKTAIEQLEFFLDPNIGVANIVEVTGIGGLGKTAIAREYMKRCINNGKVSQPQYEYYFYYTSKDEQGEIQTTFGMEDFLKPAGWEEGGGGTVIQNLGFQVFLKKICTALNLDVKRSDLANHLNSNQVLIVLDNFEDVDQNNKREYSEFFRSINLRSTRSRVIVTSRKDRQFDGTAFELKLKQLNGIEATKLISERFNFYIGKDPSKYSLGVRTAIQKYVNDGKDLVKDVVDALVDFPKVEDVQENLRHPLMLLRLASILASNLTAVGTQSEMQVIGGEEVPVVREQTIVSSLAEVIRGDYGFDKHEEQVMDWIVKKAYDDVMNDPFCDQILQELLRHEDGLTKASIRRRLEENTEFKANSYIKGVNEGISKLSTHVVFLENEDNDEEGDEVYILKSSARRLIEKIRNPSHKKPVIKDNTDSAEQIFDFTKPPQKDPKIATWQDIGNYIQAIANRTNKQFQQNLLSKSIPNDGQTNTEKLLTLHEFLSECELAVFAKIEQSTHHYLEVNFDKIVQFLPFAEDRERAVSFSIKHASLLAKHHKRLSEATISYLASNWFGKAFSAFSKLSELLQFEISVKLLHSSIQHNKVAVYQHFISLIQRLGERAILDAYHEEAERALLRPHLERFAAGIEWSLPLQRVYDELTEQRQPKDKFRSDVVQTYLKSAFSNYTISFHDDSPSRELTPGATCFVCDHDEDEKKLVLYVKPTESLHESVHREASAELIVEVFSRWISSIGRDLPGLSADVITFAADLKNGVDFHNNYFIHNTNHSDASYTNAMRMVKMFRTYQSVERHAISMAFYIGYHSTGMLVTLEEVISYLKKEICERRLHRLSQPNRYVPQALIPEMEDCFERHLSAALKAISENSEAVSAQMILRKKEIETKILPAFSILGEKSKSKLTGTSRRLPPGERFDRLPLNIRQTYLRPLVGRPIFGRGKLREDLIKLAGGDAVIRYEKTGQLSTWINVIVSVVWSLTETSTYVRVTETNLDEVCQQVLESYNHAIRAS